MAAGRPIATQRVLEERHRGILADLLLAQAADMRLVPHAVGARAAAPTDVVRGAPQRLEEHGDLRIEVCPVGEQGAYDAITQRGADVDEADVGPSMHEKERLGRLGTRIDGAGVAGGVGEEIAIALEDQEGYVCGVEIPRLEEARRRRRAAARP